MNKSGGGLPRCDRHKADMRSGAFCRAAWLTYDPSIWSPESRRNKSTGNSASRNWKGRRSRNDDNYVKLTDKLWVVTDNFAELIDNFQEMTDNSMEMTDNIKKPEEGRPLPAI
ncbi:hypothetical protein ACFPTP_17055 [Sporosarcina koreensis]|uniref:Uncharacterized protein n=1 Tax=Sporosarcina koreensis TaxID=334735 RepID=A0ABW0U0W0_9BACL